MAFWEYRPYVRVADRQSNARKEMDKLRKKGKVITPIEKIAGRKIASTFWGNAWCAHIECLSDFASRLDRGRTYVRNGSVCHLAISKGRVDAVVCGSELYEIRVDIDPLPAKRWEAIKTRCRGDVGTAVELLQGKFSDEVMRVLTDPDKGMFPDADDFRLDCSCPDFARLCKHLAAVLYGVGARLDHQPELLFELRGVDHLELIEQAASAPTAKAAALDDAALADVFGIDIAPAAPSPPTSAKTPKRTPKSAKAKRQTKSKKKKR